MNTYKVRGADQQEYGPVTADQVREWLQQRRANATTLVQLEGTDEWKPIGSIAEFNGSLTPPTLPPLQTGTAQAGSAENPVSVLVPYKNPQALTAYYLGVFSLIPCLGLLLGIGAVICGVLGLKFLKRNPGAHGLAHAWIGIGLGGFCALANTVFIIFMIVSMVSRH
jgi:hypothetical protein